MRSKRQSVWLRTAIAVLVALLLLVPFSQAFADGPKVSRDYLLEVQPSAADTAILSRAYAELGRVDEAALELLSEFSDKGVAVARAYDKLDSDLQSASTESTFWVLQDTPASAMRSFEEGTLAMGALFAAAGDARPIDDASGAPSDSVLIQTVDSTARLDSLQKRVDKLDAAIEKLDEDSAAVLAGTFEVADLDTEKLEHLAQAEGPLAGEAQLQLDRNLAANLPDLSDQANGEMDPDLLCEIPWWPQERLLCAAMDNFVRMNEAYRGEFGTDLPILDGYRPINEQYYVHAVTPSMTAIPGTSNHGLGQAVDFDWDVFEDWSDPEVEWMIQNGPDYGFRLPSALGPTTDRPEPWHYEFGTSYSDDNDADFLGPSPDVVYRVLSPWNR